VRPRHHGGEGVCWGELTALCQTSGWILGRGKEGEKGEKREMGEYLYPFAFQRKGKETEVNLRRKGEGDIGEGGRTKGKEKERRNGEWGRERDEFCVVVIFP